MTVSAAASVAVALVLAVVGAAAGHVLLVRGRRTEVAERLRRLIGDPGGAGIPTADNVRRIDVVWLPHPLRVRLARAEVAVNLPVVVVGSLGIVVLPAAAGGMGGVVAATAVAASLPLLGWTVLNRLARRRSEAFLEALPSWLDSVRQLVVVGNSLQQAIQRATRDGPPPVRRYLEGTLHQLHHGVPLGEALDGLADRYDLVEIHMISSALQANLRYGGRLSEVLSNLIGVFRDRLRMDREMRAMTAETRMSTWVLAALPVLVVGAVGAWNPSYVAFYVDNETGHWLLAASIAMEAAGIFAMRRLMRVTF